MLYHDPLPPWGFDFLLRVNCQAWWHYTHYGFNPKCEPHDWDAPGYGESLSDEASVGERPDCHDAEEEQEASKHPDSAPDRREESASGGDIPQSSSGSAEQYRNKEDYGPSSDPSKEDLGCAPGHTIPERKSPVRGLSSGGLPRCSISCKVVDAGTCALQNSCGKEDMSLLPSFDWEEDDVGQYFEELL